MKPLLRSLDYNFKPEKYSLSGYEYAKIWQEEKKREAAIGCGICALAACFMHKAAEFIFTIPGVQENAYVHAYFVLGEGLAVALALKAGYDFIQFIKSLKKLKIEVYHESITKQHDMER